MLLHAVDPELGEGSFRLSTWGLVVVLVSALLAALGGINLYQLQAARCDLGEVRASVVTHHTVDEGRDAQCKAAVEEVMRSQQASDAQRNRMENKIDRIAYRLGVQTGRTGGDGSE